MGDASIDLLNTFCHSNLSTLFTSETLFHERVSWLLRLLALVLALVSLSVPHPKHTHRVSLSVVAVDLCRFFWSDENKYIQLFSQFGLRHWWWLPTQVVLGLVGGACYVSVFVCARAHPCTMLRAGWRYRGNAQNLLTCVTVCQNDQQREKTFSAKGISVSTLKFFSQ